MVTRLELRLQAGNKVWTSGLQCQEQQQACLVGSQAALEKGGPVVDINKALVTLNSPPLLVELYYSSKNVSIVPLIQHVYIEKTTLIPHTRVEWPLSTPLYFPLLGLSMIVLETESTLNADACLIQNPHDPVVDQVVDQSVKAYQTLLKSHQEKPRLCLYFPFISLENGMTVNEQLDMVFRHLESLFTALKPFSHGIQVHVVLSSSQNDALDERIQAFNLENKYPFLSTQTALVPTSEGLGIYVVESTWRLNPASHSHSDAVYQRGGSTLVQALSQQHPHPATPGHVYPVVVPSTCPLYQHEGCALVIHSISPNLVPTRPDCIQDVTLAHSMAENLIQSIFNLYTRIIQRLSKTPPAQVSSWKDALNSYCQSPQDYPDQVYFYNQDVVVIKDAYPKAMVHYLVMPRQLIFTPLHLFSSLLIPILLKMKKVADDVLPPKGRIGFHRIPSMRQLHLHVISSDMFSPYLKTKVHWNSFQTDFFIPFDTLMHRLESGSLDGLEEASHHLKTPLECSQCRLYFKTMPQLKLHLLQHL